MIHTSARRAAVRHAFAAAAVGALLLAGTTACSSSSPEKPSGPESLTLTIWGNDTDKKVMTERLALAKKKLPNITVTLQQISDDYDTKLQTMFAGGKAPDVLQVAEAVNVYSSKGQLVDLTKSLSEDGVKPVESFGQGLVDTYSTDGKLWAAPDRSGAAVVYYNKTLFDKAGVAYPTGSWTWDDMREASKKLTVTKDGRTTQWAYGAGDWWPWYMSWMYQNGGRVLDSAGKPVVNSPENVKALEFYNSLVFTDKSALSPADYANQGLNNGQPDPLFAQGKLAMNVTGFWNISSLKDSGIKWGIAPLWHGADAAVPAFSSALAVSAQSKHTEAAAKLVAFLTSPEGQKPIAEAGLDVPANLAAVADTSFQKPAWNTTGVDLSVFTSSAANVFAPPLVPKWNQIQKAFTDGLAETWNGKQSVQDGLDKVQATLVSLLG